MARTLVVNYRDQVFDAPAYDFSYIDSYSNLENIVYYFSKADNFNAQALVERITNEHSELNVFVYIDGERVK